MAIREFALHLQPSLTSLVGPIVASDEARSAELEVSLLERLFERPLYSTYAPEESLSPHRPLPYTKLVKVSKISFGAILHPSCFILSSLSSLTFNIIYLCFWVFRITVATQRSSCPLQRYFTMTLSSHTRGTGKSHGQVYLTRFFRSSSSARKHRRRAQMRKRRGLTRGRLISSWLSSSHCLRTHVRVTLLCARVISV
jgi:hypothetical protein